MIALAVVCQMLSLGQPQQSLSRPKDLAPAPASAHIDIVEQPADARLQKSRELATDDSSDGLVTLWLLAHDPEHQVVGSALEAALSRCRRKQDEVCLASLYFFMDAEVEDSPEAWRARTTLLSEQPELARAYASRETKLDVVALLAGRMTGGLKPTAWVSALQLLATDPEPDVQDAASAVLLQLER